MFVDDAFASRSKYDAKTQHEDETISGFLSHLLWVFLQSITPHSERRRADLKRVLEFYYTNEILLEIFIRAPWQLLPFRMDREWVAMFQKDLKKYPEAFPRVWRPDDIANRMCAGRHHDLPYVTSPTRHEVLTILKSRM